MSLKEQIIAKVGVNNLFKIADINFASSDVLKSTFYRGYKAGEINKYKNGYYFFNSLHTIGSKIFYNKIVDIYKFISDKYISDKNGNVVGFDGDQEFMVSRNFDTQCTVEHTIFTNNIKTNKLVYEYGGEKYIIKKYNLNINNDNAEYLAFLQCLKNYDILSYNGIYDNGEYSNLDEIKEYLSQFDKVKLIQLSEQFTRKTRERLKQIYATVCSLKKN